MAKKVTCNFKKSIMDPCFCTDGAVALDGDGKCLTCKKTKTDLEKPEAVPTTPAPKEVVLTPEQMAEILTIATHIASSMAMELRAGMGISSESNR